MPIDRERLIEHVAALAAGPRPAESVELESARERVSGHLREAGWEVDRHEFSVAFGDERLAGTNLVAHQPDRWTGTGPRLVVGAHLDSLPETPGADDNASAVAVLLEIARVLPSQWPAEPQLELELVAFDLEEHGMLGGAEHARLMHEQSVELAGMVSLEMLGYCDQASNTQSLPRQLVGIYPDTADFIAVIGNQRSQALIDSFHADMAQIEGLPVESLAVEGNGEMLQATRLSDHSPFWDAGFAALMITDTSFMRNPHYHQSTDTPDTLDYDFLERVAAGCLNAVATIVAEGISE